MLAQNKPKRFITIGRSPSVSLAKARDVAKKLIAEKTLGRLPPKRISFIPVPTDNGNSGPRFTIDRTSRLRTIKEDLRPNNCSAP